VLHVIRHPHAFRPDAPAGTPSLWRWTIDPTAGAVTQDQIDDRPTEFPRIDERHTGHPTSLNLSELRSCRSVGLDEIVMAVESLWHKVIS